MKTQFEIKLSTGLVPKYDNKNGCLPLTSQGCAPLVCSFNGISPVHADSNPKTLTENKNWLYDQ